MVASSSYNLVGDGTGSVGLTNGVNNNQVGSGASPINPQLGPLADNGGPTFTHALLPASPAINTANNATCAATDQRGIARPFGGVCDIGAFEFAEQADLALIKTVNDSTPNVGDDVTFTITLTNLGPDTATAVQVTDLLPAGLTFVSATPSQGSYNSATGLWTVGSVTTAAPQTLTLTATVVSPVAQTNTATISDADQFDPNPGNNSASSTETPQQADLALTKTVSDPTPNVGDQVTFTVTLTNNGPDAATGVQVTDLLPPVSALCRRPPAKAATTPRPVFGRWAQPRSPRLRP